MAVQAPGLDLGYREAGADLSSSQFFAVKKTSAGIVLAGAGEKVAGILQNDPVSGDPANVRFIGGSKAVIGAAVVNGAFLASNANGKLVTATSNDNVCAQALEAGGADGEVINVLVQNFGVLP